MLKVIQTVRHKCSQGYFGWVKFELPKDEIKEIKKFLDGNDDVLRYLIIKTVRENTLLNGKMIFKKEEIMKKDVEVSEEEVAGEPATPEEIDKSIDELVIS
jgi:ribosomal protein S6